MASPTRWTWVWVDSGSWWSTGRPGVLWFMGLQRVEHDWVTELNWKTSRGALFLPPSDVYVRSFLYLFYTLINIYCKKALSDEASSLALDWILLLQMPRIPASFMVQLQCFSFILFRPRPQRQEQPIWFAITRHPLTTVPQLGKVRVKRPLLTWGTFSYPLRQTHLD